jgi:phenylacetic acid degradation protein
MFYEFNGHRPVVHPSAFVHPQAAVTGDVIIGKDVYVGPGAAIRGDWGRIIIEDGCNVQENCTIHLFPGVTVRLRQGAHIGHGAIIHGATIGRNCLIGMNAVILDNAEIGDECIVGALSLVKTGEVIPPRSVVVGSPAKIIRSVSDEMLNWKSEGTAIYQALPGEMQSGWKACEPLRPEEGGASGEATPVDSPWLYRPWEDVKLGTPQADRVEEAEAAYGGRQYTIEDYLREEVVSSQKHEYYRGEIFLMSGAKADHNRIVGNLYIGLWEKLKGSTCEAFNDDQRVYVEKNTLFTYPDVSIVCGEPVFYNNDQFNLMNPIVIIEVLSPSTQKYDKEGKFLLYQDLPSFGEYFLFDSRSVSVQQFIRDTKGNWNPREYNNLSDTVVFETLGVGLPLEEIYRRTGFPKHTS